MKQSAHLSLFFIVTLLLTLNSVVVKSSTTNSDHHQSAQTSNQSSNQAKKLPTTLVELNSEQQTNTSVRIAPSATSTNTNRRTSSKQERNRKSHQNKATSGSSHLRPTENMEHIMQAQNKLRLLDGFSNTPPTFITATRDLYVDVAEFPLGTILTTIKAIDENNNTIEYSIQPANQQDASAYFAIDSKSGQLSLANRLLQYSASESSSATTTKSSQSIVDDKTTEGSDSVDQQSSPFNLLKNIYFLNVVADNGHYRSVLELQVHVMNTSSLERPHVVRLTPQGDARVGSIRNILQDRTREFINRQYANSMLSNNQTTALVYPNYINVGSISNQPVETTNQNQSEGDLQSSELEEFATTTKSTMNSPSATPTAYSSIISGNSIEATRSSNFQQQVPNQDTLPSLTSARQAVVSDDTSAIRPTTIDSLPLSPQPMVVSLVLACSCLLIALVLLMFLVPISVKRLRKRLKHVERQHEQLSQRTSHGSSTVCSNSTTSMATQSHNPSWFTLSSSDQQSCMMSNSSVCRQSSLDSAQTPNGLPIHPHMFNNRTLNRVNNGSITNSVYLQQQQQQSPHSYQQQLSQLPQSAAGIAELIEPRKQQQLRAQQQNQLFHNENFQTNVSERLADCDNNLYYPIDDDLYSIINTENNINSTNAPLSNTHNQICSQEETLLDQCTIFPPNYFMAKCEQPDFSERPMNSPAASDSGSSMRSLARFLSLPARHASHTQQNTILNNEELKLVDGEAQVSGSKTVARASNISREQQVNHREHVWELDRLRLTTLKILDEGQFGLVWRCKLKQAHNQELTVAVKTLKKRTANDPVSRDELLAEIEIMKLVSMHPNVVKILHCCTKDTVTDSAIDSLALDSKPILLVMEYVELGKLQSFLEKSRINHHYATNHYDGITTDQHLTSKDLVKFIYHIAKGMEYISAQCIVHRDLASRNILVSSQRVCKIGDFGMARHMKSLADVYERHSRHTKVPVRWMAPEVLLSNRFTTKSDVFSFGILMWEIVTLGSTPYRHLETNRVIEAVARQGERPEKPEYCHSQLYHIMSKCWSHDPQNRPTFSSLVQQLDELLLSAEDYIELDQYPDHDYYNIPKTAAPHELL